jgi:hypothetical protein
MHDVCVCVAVCVFVLGASLVGFPRMCGGWACASSMPDNPGCSFSVVRSVLQVCVTMATLSELLSNASQAGSATLLSTTEADAVQVVDCQVAVLADSGADSVCISEARS